MLGESQIRPLFKMKNKYKLKIKHKYKTIQIEEQNAKSAEAHRKSRT